MMDLLTTQDGKVAKELPKKAVKPHIPIFGVNPDIMAPSEFQLPRLAHGAFVIALKHIYQ